MSSDNGIYVASWPTDDGDVEYRVAYGFESTIDELDTHWLTPEESRDAKMDIWGKSVVFLDIQAALYAAQRLQESYGYTEYGICTLTFFEKWGELRDAIPKPELSEGACPICSTPGSMETYHGGNTPCDREVIAQCVHCGRDVQRGTAEGITRTWEGLLDGYCYPCAQKVALEFVRAAKGSK